LTVPGIRLGTNPIAWSNDDLRSLGADITLEQCLREARAAGYEGIELGHKFPRTAQELGPLLAAHGLALVSGWYSTALLGRSIDDEWHAMAPHLELLRALDARVVIVAETTRAVHGDIDRPLSTRPRLERAELRSLAHRLAQLAERSAEAGLTLAYHHHMGTVVQDRDEVDCLMASSGDALHLLLDTGHAAFAQIDPAALARDYATRVAHVHCKDVRRERLAAALACDRSFLDAVVDGVFTVPGDGMLDFASVLMPLAAAGYEGWLVVEAEQDPARAAPSRYARQGWQALKHAARQAGFDVSGGSE
jgi:inosose dehydratase